VQKPGVQVVVPRMSPQVSLQVEQQRAVLPLVPTVFAEPPAGADWSRAPTGARLTLPSSGLGLLEAARDPKNGEETRHGHVVRPGETGD
jgi:hypothetical protein